MPHDDKTLTTTILAAEGLAPSRLGLRFDRVVGRVLRDLRSAFDRAAPPGVVALVAISAPIRLPAQTVSDLNQALQTLLATPPPQPDWAANVHGNQVRLRVIPAARGAPPSLIGFVHNPGTASDHLLDLAERWVQVTG
jgi:hypothetical protein